MHPVLQRPPDVDAAGLGGVVGQQDVDVHQVEGEEQPRPERAERHPARAAVARVDVVVPRGIVELADAARHDDVVRHVLAVVDRRIADRRAAGRHRRQVFYHERRCALLALLRRKAHRETVAVGILQMAVHPGLGALGKLRRQLARRQHRLAVAVGQPVAIDVDVVELVVEPDLLDLAEGPKERTVVPEPDVPDGVVVVGQVAHLKARLGRIVAFGNAVDAKGPAGEGDVVLEVGPLASELVRIDIDRMDRRRKDAQQDDVRADRCADAPCHQPQVAPPCRHHRKRRDHERDRGHHPKRRHHHLHAHIAGAPDGAARRVEQAEAIEDVAGRGSKRDHDKFQPSADAIALRASSSRHAQSRNAPSQPQPSLRER